LTTQVGATSRTVRTFSCLTCMSMSSVVFTVGVSPPDVAGGASVFVVA
jgi:hypothetical protein